MRHSDTFQKVATAMFAVQKKLEPIKKDSTNPHFKNRYASLEAINEYMIDLANSEGLLIVQGGGELTGQNSIAVETMVIHAASGEWMSAVVEMPLQKSDPQGSGSALTYGRRYGLCAIFCISTEEDDDAEGAVSRAPRTGVQSVASQTGHQAPPARQAARPAASSPAPACPKCGSDMWDNRGRKTNPKAPDFRCKDKANCDGAIWPEKQPQQATTATQQRVARAVAPAPPEWEPQDDRDVDLPF